MIIRPYKESDWPGVWSILEPVFQSGDTYPFPTGISEDDANQVWINTPQQVYITEEGGKVVGSYYIKHNQPGQGAHVCNCGYLTALDQRGRGIAEKMCTHSLQQARRLGVRAMQFNLVVSSNEDAVHLWQKMGFSVVGRLPGAFDHPRLGYVDALVMYQRLY